LHPPTLYTTLVRSQLPATRSSRAGVHDLPASSHSGSFLDRRHDLGGHFVWIDAPATGRIEPCTQVKACRALAPEPAMHRAIDHRAGAFREPILAATREGAILTDGLPVPVESFDDGIDSLVPRGHRLQHRRTPALLLGASGLAGSPQRTVMRRKISQR